MSHTLGRVATTRSVEPSPPYGREPDQAAPSRPDGKVRSLYIVGGQQHTLRPLHAGAQPWYRYAKGVIVRVELATGEVHKDFEYLSPPDVCSVHDPAILFKSGTLVGNRLYLCTQTEVLIFQLPGFERLHYISLPHFNDLHHVCPTAEGTLLIANTGLDMVMEITTSGEVVREWDVLGGNPWERFSRAIDYRTVASTKPHKAHPNYVFCIGDDVWATRFEQRDAVCLTDPSKRVEIGFERVHDGVVHGDRIYFTSVDGRIICVDQATLRVVNVWDLTRTAPGGELLGWCRGLLIDEGKIWIGFSRLRPTKFRENVGWVASGFKKVLPTRIACYDLANGACLRSIEMESYGLNAVFSIHSFLE